MSSITIGTDPRGKAIKLDIPLLVPSRLLITANSGGGKSWLLRRLAEQLFGHMQTIIIDPEGEFYTLREKFGFVLVGEGGETPADIRSAEMLAERFLELKVSAVCDLYEAFRSRPMERRQWVRRFINALIDAPRRLWHPLIVIVDEAHKFCPQETPKAASQIDREIIGGCKDAMIALSTTGRKRGFCPVWATQRLAKLDKDASAEFFNRLVGMTIEDVDVDRASDLMSVSREDKAAFRQSLRTISPGEFYAFGRAITIERKLVRVGAIATRHPESGKQAAGSAPPPMPAEVKKFLPQLSDLPAEAEQKARTVAELERQVREMKVELKKAQAAAPVKGMGIPKPDPAAAQKLALAQRAERQLQTAANDLAKVLKAMRDYQASAILSDLTEATSRLLRIQKLHATSADGLTKLQRQANDVLNKYGFQHPETPAPKWGSPTSFEPAKFPPDPAPAKTIATMPAPRIRAVATENGEFRPSNLHVQIAAILAAYWPQPIKSTILASLVGKTTGGSWSGRLSELRSAGLLEDPAQGIVRATEKCAAEFAGKFQIPRSTAEVREIWAQRLGPKPIEMLDVLIARGGDPVSTTELAQQVGLTTGGSFSGRLSELRASGLIIEPGRGQVAANKEALFMETPEPARNAV